MKTVALLLGAALLVGCERASEVPRLTALEERVADLERTQLVSRPFLRNVSRQEMSTLLEFSLAVSVVQRSGFQFSHVDAGTHGTSFVFRRGNETLTKIVLIHEP